MAVATFDTLKFTNTLKAAGVPPQQAEAQAVAFAEVIQINLKDLVTKDDLTRGLDDLRKDFKAEVTDAKQELRHELKEVEQRLGGRIDLLAAKFDVLAAKTAASAVDTRASVTLLRWVIGLNATVVFGLAGLAVRYIIFRGLP